MQESALSVRGEADIRQAHRERREQDLLPVADGGVPADMGLDLPFAAALRSEDRERQQLALVDGQKLSRIKIAEAVGGEIVLNVLLVLRRGGAHRVDVVAEDRLLRRDAI